MSALDKLERKLGKGLGPERAVRVLPPKEEERTPKRVRITTRQYVDGKNWLEAPEEFEVTDVGSNGSYWVDAGRNLGRVPVERSNCEVIAWHGAAKSQPLPTAARAEKKPTTSTSSTAAAETPIGELPIERLPLAQLVRHPKNRQPTAESIEKIAASMKTDGQFETLYVRRWSEGATGFKSGEYQIVSGETRYLAAKKIRLAELNCRVLTCSDARALELLIVLNSKRTDLNPIEKAQNIRDLCAPIAAGGCGKTREQAAQDCGLESGAAASNLLRLLELPKVWQDRVISGELPQTQARPLTALAAAPRLLALAEKDWQKAHAKNAPAWHGQNWKSREDVEEFVEGLISNHTRPIDKRQTHDYGYDEVGCYDDFPRQFELTDEIRESLEIVTFKVGEKETELATNVEAYDALNIPLIRQKVEKAKKNKAEAVGSGSQKSKKISPAEKAKRLKEYIAGWRHEWLRSLVIAELKKGAKPLQQTIARKAIAALTLNNWEPIRVSLALQESSSNRKICRSDGEAYRRVNDLGADTIDAWYVNALELILGRDDADSRRPALDFDFVDAVAAEQHIDLAAEWRALQTSGPKFDRDRIEGFLLLHTSEQLRDLVDEWNVHVPDGKTRKVMIEIILGVARMLPLPKSVAKLPTAAYAKKPKKKGAA